MDRDLWDRVSPHVGELVTLSGDERQQRMEDLRQTDLVLADAVARVMEQIEPDVNQTLAGSAYRSRSWGAAGKRIGPYTLEAELGRGGMGSVWRARRTDGRYEGLVAIKFLDMALSGVGGAQRFEREGQILARLTHPNIARLVDAGVAEGAQSYLVLEFIDGRPIDDYCQAHALDTRARLRLMLDVLAAVAHAHSRLILHRDLKPANVLVTKAGEVKLLDFGIAKLLDEAAGIGQATELTQMAGGPCTPAYAAPEQALGEDVSTQTDVYALGLMLYLLLCGVHPTNPDGMTRTRAEEFKATLHTQPRRMSEAALAAGQPALARELRGDLDNIVAKALKKVPAERYANASELADDLRRHLDDEPVSARPDGAGYLAWKFLKRHRLGVAAVSALVLSLAGGITASVWQAREARAQRVQAEGLVEFMLGDLRKKLQPVGRLDVLDAVGEKALAYYDAQDGSRLDADSLGRRARALHLIGEIAQQRGKLGDALKVFQAAAESTGHLMEMHPGDARRVFDHSQSVFWVGNAAREQGHGAEARAAFQRYRELAQKLVQMDPGKLEWRVEAAYSATNLAVADIDNDEPQAALPLLAEALGVFSDAQHLQPALAYEVAGAHGWRAKALERMGRYADALTEQDAKRAILLEMPGAAEDRRALRLIADADIERGAIELCCGSPEIARQLLESARQRLNQLASLDETNIGWQRSLAYAELQAFDAALAVGSLDDAQAALDRAAAIVEMLARADPANATWGIGFAGWVLVDRYRLAQWRGQSADPGELTRFMADLRRDSNRIAVADPQLAWPLASMECQLAEFLVGTPDGWAKAQALLRSAAARMARRANSGDMAATVLLARISWRQGNTEALHRLLKRVETSEYRHPAYAELVKALAQEAGQASVQPVRR